MINKSGKRWPNLHICNMNIFYISIYNYLLTNQRKNLRRITYAKNQL